MLYCDAFKIGKIEKANFTKHHLPGKHSWKDHAPVAVNERTQAQHYLERCLQKGVEFALRNQENGAPFVKLVCVLSHVLKLFI